MIRTRLALAEDWPRILPLFRAHAEEFGAHLGFDEDRTRELFHNAVTKASPTVWVAECEGDLIGYLAGEIYGYFFTSGIYVQQELIFVRPDKRGTRAAVKLIREFIRWGDMLGARELFFGTSTNFQPERTARLFEHFGAERVGYSLKKVR